MSEVQHSRGNGRASASLTEQHHLRWWLAGLCLICLHIVLAFLSPRFSYGGDPLKRPILILVGLEILAGLIYLAASASVRNTPRSKTLLLWTICVGFVLRACFIPSTPMLEDDYYRYLWDGAVVANGVNPYSYAPSEILQSDGRFVVVPPVLVRLAAESGVVASRINHPHLRTIYPPVAQAAFTLAYSLRPWSIHAWRLVLFIFDAATLCILILILRKLNLSSLWSVLYWWNPILIKETFNSGHMDVVIMPFVLGAVLLAIGRKHLLSAVCLALAMGAKVWPVVLFPFLMRPLLGNPRKLVVALCLVGLVGAAMFAPIYAGGLDSDSGFAAYGKRWEVNDVIFMGIVWGARFFLKIAGMGAGYSQLVARCVVVLLLAAWFAWLARNDITDGVDLCGRCMLGVAAIFLLSPAQFPWYFIWLIPFLAIRPRLSLLLLTVLLPLYYLRFYFAARDKVAVFDYGIVWIEYIPVCCLLVWEWYAKKGKGSGLQS